MKKSNRIRVLLLVFIGFIFFLGACKKNESNLYGFGDTGLLKVSKPNTEIDINGKWKLMSSHVIDISTKKELEYNKEEESLFITNSIFDYKDIEIIKPEVSARFITMQGYLRSKGLALPKTLNLNDQNVVVYKFQDGSLLSQEVIELKNGRLLIFQNNIVEIYEKFSQVSKEEEEEKYKHILNVMEDTGAETDNRDYAISISVRRNKYAESGEIFDYDYSTFFIVRNKENPQPHVLSVDNIVFSKDSVLWTVSHSRTYSDDKKPVIIDKISANPTFRDEADKVNFLQERVARRIDYINDNYIATTNKNLMIPRANEYYEIQNLNQLSKNTPLKINNIGGAEGLDNYNTALANTISRVANQTDSVLDYRIVDTNVGIKRDRMIWKFISNFDGTREDDGSSLYRSIDLQFIPIIDIAGSDNKKISWNDVTTRVSGAKAAEVSPEGKYIIIQTEDQIAVYAIHNNFISINPEFTIVNVDHSDVVMTKWYSKEMVDQTYEDFLKLPKRIPQVIY